MEDIHVPGVDGTTLSFPVINLLALWQHLISTCAAFGRHVLSIGKGQQSLYLYLDEVTPGNPLQPCNQKKAYAFYASTSGMWQQSSSESAWWALALLRTVDKDLIQGGLTTFFCALVKTVHKWRLGQLLKVGSESLFVSLRLTMVFADEPALKAALACKGSAGRKVCFRCANVHGRAAGDLNAVHAAGLQSLSAQLHECQFVTDKDVFEVVDLLQEQSLRVSRSRLSEMETSLGWSAVPDGLLCDKVHRSIAPPSIFCYDPMHVFWVHGLFSLHTMWLLSSLRRLGWERNAVIDSLLDLNGKIQGRQKLTSSQIRRSLQPEFFNDGGWKANASTQVAIVPLLHFWAMFMVPPPAGHAEAVEFRCFSLLCNCASIARRLKLLGCLLYFI